VPAASIIERGVHEEADQGCRNTQQLRLPLRRRTADQTQSPAAISSANRVARLSAFGDDFPPEVKTKKLRGKAVVRGGAGTATRTVGLLGGILTYAVEAGIIESNRSHGIRKPKDNVRKRRLLGSGVGVAFRHLRCAVQLCIMAKELDNVGQRDFDFVIDGTRSGPRHGADERGKFVIDPVDQLVQQNAFQVFPFSRLPPSWSPPVQSLLHQWPVTEHSGLD
jgi:hypothetical protein